MCFASADTLVKPHPYTERIVLSAEIRLRTIPYVLDAMTGALDNGAGRIELDTTGVTRITEGAMHMLAVAQHRLNARGVQLVLS